MNDTPEFNFEVSPHKRGDMIRLNIQLANEDGTPNSDREQLAIAEDHIAKRLLMRHPKIDEDKQARFAIQNKQGTNIVVDIPLANEGLLKIVPSALNLDEKQSREYMAFVDQRLIASSKTEGAGVAEGAQAAAKSPA